MRIRLPSVWSSRCTVKVPALATLVSATKDTLRCPSGTMKRSYSVGAFMARTRAPSARVGPQNTGQPPLAKSLQAHDALREARAERCAEVSPACCASAERAPSSPRARRRGASVSPVCTTAVTPLHSRAPSRRGVRRGTAF